MMNAFTWPVPSDVRLIPLPALNDNYIWALSRNGHALVVDPGQAAPVLDWLERESLQLDAILLTHHHGDHVGGVKDILAKHPARVWGPAHEPLPTCDVRVAQSDKVELPTLELTLHVLDIPGHTAGHVAYFGQNEVKQPFVFCGDTLFAAGCGRLFEGTPAQMTDSLGKLAKLPSDTLICCAHEYTLSNLRWALQVEPDNLQLHQRWEQDTLKRQQNLPTVPSTLKTELATNPFLRCETTAVIQAAEHYGAQSLNNPVEVFASLRDWKNNF
ncbi:hydroxyacylglutathione hydrolase [Alcaligenes aquatilis]|uniref:Hydroxyacylglutathione hydrolase n=2 Tax=Alcaligenes aquatilis TaxID=323284 RepID=A0A3G2HXN3_9BURK|nr:hydroxyacylglutathione hydrolase [Alcaligenes aquatilis]AYN21926.1 hydroxyacylglutathione hydrolase [Alcaligenes aquatilis]